MITETEVRALVREAIAELMAPPPRRALVVFTGGLLGFHLSPGEQRAPVETITDGRRNLALRKFRYWCARLGVNDALVRHQPSQSPRTPS